MPRMTFDIPSVVYDRMTQYQQERKPHLSLKDVIVESLDTVLTDYESTKSASSRVNVSQVDVDTEAPKERVR